MSIQDWAHIARLRMHNHTDCSAIYGTVICVCALYLSKVFEGLQNFVTLTAASSCAVATQKQFKCMKEYSSTEEYTRVTCGVRRHSQSASRKDNHTTLFSPDTAQVPQGKTVTQHFSPKTQSQCLKKRRSHNLFLIKQQTHR